MDRQDVRAFGDFRHRERKIKLQQLQAAQAKKKNDRREIKEGAPEALVIGVSSGLCLVAVEGEEPRWVRYMMPVAPGDMVSIENEAVSGIAPRRTTLSRKDPGNVHIDKVVAANIDLIVIVSAVDSPPFRPGLVDRYLLAAARGGVTPILCLTKTDLGDTAMADNFRIPVVRYSKPTGKGLDELRDLLEGSTAVLVGQSGVGKSSLLNALAGEVRAKTGEISEATGKGQHTTTASRLYELENGARIIDTPGIREFGLGTITLEEVQQAFPEFLDAGCRFRDCRHKEEPDCPVREAGGIRHSAYLRLLAEVENSQA